LAWQILDCGYGTAGYMTWRIACLAYARSGRLRCRLWAILSPQQCTRESILLRNRRTRRIPSGGSKGPIPSTALGPVNTTTQVACRRFIIYNPPLARIQRIAAARPFRNAIAASFRPADHLHDLKCLGLMIGERVRSPHIAAAHNLSANR